MNTTISPRLETLNTFRELATNAKENNQKFHIIEADREKFTLRAPKGFFGRIVDWARSIFYGKVSVKNTDAEGASQQFAINVKGEYGDKATTHLRTYNLIDKEGKPTGKDLSARVVIRVLDKLQ